MRLKRPENGFTNTYLRNAYMTKLSYRPQPCFHPKSVGRIFYIPL